MMYSADNLCAGVTQFQTSTVEGPLSKSTPISNGVPADMTSSQPVHRYVDTQVFTIAESKNLFTFSNRFLMLSLALVHCVIAVSRMSVCLCVWGYRGAGVKLLSHRWWSPIPRSLK